LAAYGSLAVAAPFALIVILGRKTLVTCIVVGCLIALFPSFMLSALSLFKTIALQWPDSVLYWGLLLLLGGAGGAGFWCVAFLGTRHIIRVEP
jgi:hypothetical protein